MTENIEAYVKVGKSQSYLQKNYGHKTTYLLTSLNAI